MEHNEVDSNPKEKNYAMFCHLAAFLQFTSIPLANIIGPLVLWLIKREESEFIDFHGKQALNFNISFAIYAIVSFILMFVLIGFVLIIAVGITWFVLVIIGAVRTSNGEWYQYPLTIPFVR